MDIPSTVIDGAHSHQLTLQRSCYSEDVSTGSMSNLECLLISTITQYAYPDVEDWTDVDLIDADFVAKNFDTIRKIANSLGMQLPLYKWSEQEIKTALKHYQSQCDSIIAV